MVVPNAFEAEITIRQALTELAQLNEGHAYSYTRDELVAMLDQRGGAVRPLLSKSGVNVNLLRSQLSELRAISSRSS